MMINTPAYAAPRMPAPNIIVQEVALNLPHATSQQFPQAAAMLKRLKVTDLASLQALLQGSSLTAEETKTLTNLLPFFQKVTNGGDPNTIYA